MQPPVEPIRSNLTDAQVRYLIERAPSITVGFGLESTDLQQDDVTDISDTFGGGTVERSAYATLHGTCRLALSAPVDWGWAVVRPYMTLTDGKIKARFNLGAYFTNTPSRPTNETPPSYDVVGYDLLYALDVLVGDSYSVAAGDLILTRVEEILIQRGFTKYLIDQSRGDAVAPDGRVWQLSDNATWLGVVNDLLGMIGYQGIWSDWNGMLRCQAYQRPLDRGYEWYLPADASWSILGADALVEFDYHDAYNRWIGVRSNNIDDVAPVEGAGIYTLTNDSDGITSINARRGLVLTRKEDFEVTSQADLIARVQAMADADMSVPTSITCTTGPHPLMWHFDRLLVDSAALGPPTDVLVTAWSLPLNGEDMSHTWSVLSGTRS
jgi:hypothetical protein